MRRCCIPILLLLLSLAPPLAAADDSSVQQMMAQAEQWQSQGMYRQALKQLDRAAQQQPSPQQSIEINRIKGDLHHLLKQWKQSASALVDSVMQARKLHDKPLLAKVLNNYGNLLATAGMQQEASQAFEESISLLKQSNKQPLIIQRITTAINLNRLYLLQKSHHNNIDIQQLAAETANLSASRDSIKLLLALVHLARAANQRPIQATLLQRAIAQAERVNDAALIAMAHGMMGRYQAQQHHPDAALKQTRQAIFFTPDSAPEQRYRWQWQLGRILLAQQQPAAALTAYRQAIRSLNPIRSMLLRSHRMAKENFFSKQIKPVYSELAALILAKVPQATTPSARSQLLYEARAVMEELKTAELQDFLHSSCVTSSGAQMQIEDVDPYTAIVYPMMLRDHLAVIVSVGNSIRLYNSPVDAYTMRQTTLNLRRHLQTRTSNEFLHEAVALYDWIIRPTLPQLTSHRVNQLVIVPGGALRTIPFSTLYNGKQFLIEHYALAITPGLSLTDPQPMVKSSNTTLVAGLSDAVQGFSALPSVKQEMETVQSIMGGERLANKAYTIPALERALQGKEYRLIHLATHGVFAHSKEDSFLLTYDSKLNMNKLAELLSISKQRKHPVELLTMSACQTALGDDRAALGLAGIAVQAGVRSAIATLWFVDDEATALTITNFYKLLKQPGISKARALQQAQIQLIKQKRYWHPGYWGPFLLIGNWL